MQDLLVVGKVAKPQGIRGELKVVPLTDNPQRFNKLKSVIIDGKTFTTTKATVGGGFVILKLKEINDRNTAELFRNKDLLIKRQDAVPLQEGNYFIVDIIGCTLYRDDEIVGKIVDVISARTDVFVVECIDGKIMRFPFLKRVIKSVDINDCKIVAFSDKLKEVECYED